MEIIDPIVNPDCIVTLKKDFDTAELKYHPTRLMRGTIIE